MEIWMVAAAILAVGVGAFWLIERLARKMSADWDREAHDRMRGK